MTIYGEIGTSGDASIAPVPRKLKGPPRRAFAQPPKRPGGYRAYYLHMSQLESARLSDRERAELGHALTLLQRWDQLPSVDSERVRSDMDDLIDPSL